MLTATTPFIFALLALIFTTNASAVKNPPASNILTADDVILLNNGQVEVVTRSDLVAYTKDIPIASAADRYVNFQADNTENADHQIEKRCAKETVWKLATPETYLGWDVPMSGVIRAPAHTDASVNIVSGYWIGNSLSVSSSSAFELVEKFLSTTLGISYSKSLTTTYSAGYTFSIPAGKYGAIVTNPLLTRHSGTVDIGCVGNSKRVEFTGESFQSKSYSSMKWVEGIIGLCLGDSYPLQRCLGNGTLQ